MFDVFYIGVKPGLFAHEKVADSCEQAAQLSRTRYCWVVSYLVDYRDFDFLWEPTPWESEFRHAWPDQHQPDSGTYLVPAGAFTETKYQVEPKLHRLPDPDCWWVPDWIDPSSIDARWSPDPASPPYIYEFPVEWGWNHTGGPEYRVPGATQKKYAYDFVARTLPAPPNLTVSDRIADNDPIWRWRPNPTDPPYIYIFGNQWHSAEVRESARYTVPGATQVKYVSEPRCRRLPDPTGFVHLYDCEFDHSWEPDPGSPPYRYVFGNQYYPAEIMPTVEYDMPGAVGVKYLAIPAKLAPQPYGPWIKNHECIWDYTWQPEPGSPPYIYVFGNQWWPAEKMPTVEYHMPGATERKYMAGPVAMLPDNLTNWHLPPGVDTTGIDFSWVPDPGEPPYIYQFATQHQKTGGPRYHVSGATDVKYVDVMRVEVKQGLVPIIEIDHLDGHAGQIPNTMRTVRYFDNYRDTLIRLAKNLLGEYEHVWVCSSVCDYDTFDFSWHPEIWQSTMLHVFASDGEKFGDTFYMHVPTFAERAERKELLEWYGINFVPSLSVPRRPMPVIVHNDDCHVNAVKTGNWAGPLAVFTTSDVPEELPCVPLWRAETKTVVPLSPGATCMVVPKTAVPYIRTQIYDYAFIDKSQKHLYTDSPLDIVFIANGESTADAAFEALEKSTLWRPNRVHRIDGVNGRVAAYHAAARASTTPWFFAVFAKLFVNSQFDWAWQPDRMQETKHYIFHARNPVNGLEYGHQAMIAYNRDLVLANPGRGLDFTLDDAHEVVPVLSGVAFYADTPWMAWRTAFREALKLRASLPDVENEYRLEKWLTPSEVTNGNWSQCGAEDAVEYHDSVAGDPALLRLSYEWNWLASYAFMRRKLVPDA